MRRKQLMPAIWEMLQCGLDALPIGRYAISAAIGTVMMILCLWGRGWFEMVTIYPLMPYQSFPTTMIDWSKLPSAFSIFATAIYLGCCVWLSILANSILNPEDGIR